MKLRKIQIISLKVILLFTVAIFSTFIGEYLHEFLGYWKCEGSGQRIVDTYDYQNCNYADVGNHKPMWHWGYRHWLYLIMCITLFIIQVADIISFADAED